MSVPRLEQPIGEAAPYIIPAYGGERLLIPGTKSTIRILASAKESGKLISVFHMDGVTGDAPGFHYHNEAHDVFLCTKGKMKVWAGDQCRILNPGDFCAVPPKVIHQPQLLDPINESIGLVTPGQWVDFFRFVSEQYDGVVTDELDQRHPEDTLGPKLFEIKEKYDVIFQPQHQGCETSDWTDDDTKIPKGAEPYFLRANTGPRYLLGGVLSRPFITTQQCDGKFAITSIESSNKYSGESLLAKPFTFTKVHQVYCVLDGSITLTVDRTLNEVRAGETIFIPAGTKISIHFNDRYVRFWSFSSGDGLEALISQGGGSFEGTVVPDQAREIDASKLSEAARAINLEIEQ